MSKQPHQQRAKNKPRSPAASVPPASPPQAIAPAVGVFQILRIGEMGIAVGLWGNAIGDDPMRASFLLAAAFTICVIAAWTDPWIKQRKAVFILGSALAFVMTSFGIVLYNKPEMKPIDAVVSMQINDFLKLQSLLGGKDESDLRELFDYRQMMKFNARLDKRTMFPKTISASDSKEIDDFFKDGQAIFDTRYVSVTTNGGPAVLNWIPGKVGLINISAKYVSNKKKLLEFETSANMPKNIQADVKDLDDTVSKDATLLLDVINDIISKDPQYLISEEDNSPDCCHISTSYWKKFSPLKPKAEKVFDDIRAYINVQ